MFNEITGHCLRAFDITRSADQAAGRRTIRQHTIQRNAALLAAAGCWLVAGYSQPLSAAIVATAEITAQQIDSNTYQYDITLNDTGTTNIATFWYAWIPGDGFLHSQPTNVQAPAGWTDSVTNAYAIQWLDGGTPLTSGNSLSGFQFDSVDTPSQVFGLSQAFPTTPVGTSVVYIASSPTGPSDEFVVQSTPEPSTLILFSAGTIGLLLAARRGRGAGRLRRPGCVDAREGIRCPTAGP